MNNIEKIARAMFVSRHGADNLDGPIARYEVQRLDTSCYRIPQQEEFMPAWAMYWSAAKAVAEATGVDPDNAPVELDTWILIRKSELDRLKGDSA
jgi:hypothetical protein